MKVSVIVPVYNGKKYIENTVRMLVNQSLQDMEIILIDDGSTDGTSEICETLKKTDDRIKVLHTKNNGVSAARNRGIAMASGDYISFADADDEPSSILYETLYLNAVNNNCQLSCAKYAMRYLNGAIIRENGTQELKKYQRKEDILDDFLREKVQIGIYTIMIKKEVAKSLLFEEGRKINEDKKFIFDAICSSESWCYIDHSLYTYVKREDSVTTSFFSEKYLDGFYFVHKIEKQLVNEYPELINAGKVYTIGVYLTILQKLCLSGQVLQYKDLLWQSYLYLRQYKISFCKKNLKRNVFIKWMCMKIHPVLFYLMIKVLAKS